MRDYVQLEPKQIRELLSRGAYLTVDHEARDAFLHSGEVTSPVDTGLVEELVADGFIHHLNQDDPTIHVAIYQH